MTSATYAHPAQVDTYVMSATHSWSGRVGAKLRLTRSGYRSARRPAIVVRLTLPRTTPVRPASRMSRSTVQRATAMPIRLSTIHIFRAPNTE